MSARRLPISLIIPVGSPPETLTPVLTALLSSDVTPSEVILVDALGFLASHSQDFDKLLLRLPSSSSHVIKTIYSVQALLPGEARNLGILHTSCSFIGFLDVSTIPSPEWLGTAYSKLIKSALPIVYGSTKYIPDGYHQRLAVAVTYGLHPTLTLPGSVFRRAFFASVGSFLPSIRAGEDTDWLLRSFNFCPATVTLIECPLKYTHVPPTLFSLLRKWHRNYSSCSSVVFHLERQKSYYFFFTSLVLLLFAYQWNSVFANWDEQSFFYLANITKFSLAAVILSYVTFRVFIRSLSKGAPLRFLVLSFAPLIMYSLLIDITKLIAFLFPQRSRTTTP